MIVIKQGDITQENVEVVVNAANTRLCGGGGVDGAIHRAAGPTVLEECRQIGGCKTGHAVITNAGNLQAKKIIHTVGPVWSGGTKGENELLRNCYEHSFKLAAQHGAQTIAFPAISTGVYGYPKEEAAQIALGVGKKFEGEFEEIRYICFSYEDLMIYEAAQKKVNDMPQ